MNFFLLLVKNEKQEDVYLKGEPAQQYENTKHLMILTCRHSRNGKRDQLKEECLATVSEILL